VYWICRGARPTPPILACAPVHTWCTHGVSIKYNIYSCWGISDHTALPMRAAVHMQRKLRTQMHRRCGPSRCGEHFTSRGVVDAGHPPRFRPKMGRSRLPCPYRPPGCCVVAFEATVPVSSARRPKICRSRLPCPYRPPGCCVVAFEATVPVSSAPQAEHGSFEATVPVSTPQSDVDTCRA
jgi:hypothetical protein